MFMVRRVAAAAWLLSAAVYALDTSKLQPRGYVNDFAGVIDPRSVQTLELYCGNLERATGAQVAIVTIKSLEDEPIEDVANRLYREWGIGKKGKDEGILLLLAIQDRKQRAEVGYGLEPVITDGYAGSVLRGIRPILRQGNYGGGLLAAAQEFGSRIAQDKGVTVPAEPAATVRPAEPVNDLGSIWGIVLVIVIFVLFLRLMSGGRGGGDPGGGTGFLAGMLLGNLLGRRRDGGGFGGGGFGGYDTGGGGGGFGGFGGGDSGGGGASSDW